MLTKKSHKSHKPIWIGWKIWYFISLRWIYDGMLWSDLNIKAKWMTFDDIEAWIYWPIFYRWCLRIHFLHCILLHLHPDFTKVGSFASIDHKSIINQENRQQVIIFPNFDLIGGRIYVTGPQCVNTWWAILFTLKHFSNIEYIFDTF